MILISYEEEEVLILNRIIGNVEKMNESMLELNRAIQQINIYNSNIAEVVELWSTYSRNVRYNLEVTLLLLCYYLTTHSLSFKSSQQSTKTLQDPI